MRYFAKFFDEPELKSVISHQVNITQRWTQAQMVIFRDTSTSIQGFVYRKNKRLSIQMRLWFRKSVVKVFWFLSYFSHLPLPTPTSRPEQRTASWHPFLKACLVPGSRVFCVLIVCSGWVTTVPQILQNGVPLKCFSKSIQRKKIISRISTFFFSSLSNIFNFNHLRNSSPFFSFLEDIIHLIGLATIYHPSLPDLHIYKISLISLLNSKSVSS